MSLSVSPVGVVAVSDPPFRFVYVVDVVAASLVLDCASVSAVYPGVAAPAAPAGPGATGGTGRTGRTGRTRGAPCAGGDLPRAGSRLGPASRS